jgi:hypothetical protein
MDETPRTPSSESSGLDAGAWIGRVVIAVILAEAIWGFIVSVTNGLVLPLLARTMGGDVQSPLYLGKGDINVPALFTAVLELCFAGIAAVVLNSFLQRKSRVPRKLVRVTSTPAQPSIPVQSPAPPPSVPVAAPVQAAVSVPPPVTPAVSAPAPVMIPAAPPQVTASATASSPTTARAPDSGQSWSPPTPSPQAKTAAPPPLVKPKPAKPKPPKEIYYNIVGEPINPTEDD